MHLKAMVTLNEKNQIWGGMSWSAELLPLSVCVFLNLYFIFHICLLSCVNEVLQAELDLSFTLQSCVDVCHWTPLLI